MNKVSDKGGRPRLPEHRKRTNDVRVLFNDMEYAIVKVKAAKAVGSRGEAARQLPCLGAVAPCLCELCALCGYELFIRPSGAMAKAW